MGRRAGRNRAGFSDRGLAKFGGAGGPGKFGRFGGEQSFRVLSGKLKGAKLDFPGSAKTHPMGAREKLALFNIVSVSGLRVLDAYAGSGALGIEALSRGAREVVFVEKAPKVAQVIRGNLEKAGVALERGGGVGGYSVVEASQESHGSAVRVFAESVGKFAERPEFTGEFDVILVDPPYDKFSEVGAELDGLARILAPGGELVLSSPAELEPVRLAGLEVVSTRTYARARVTVYGMR